MRNALPREHQGHAFFWGTTIKLIDGHGAHVQLSQQFPVGQVWRHSTAVHFHGQISGHSLDHVPYTNISFERGERFGISEGVRLCCQLPQESDMVVLSRAHAALKALPRRDCDITMNHYHNDIALVSYQHIGITSVSPQRGGCWGWHG